MKTHLRLFILIFIIWSSILKGQTVKTTPDSLLGFNETPIRSMLLADGVSKEESEIYLQFKKRSFIKEKYFPIKQNIKTELKSADSSYNNAQVQLIGNCGNIDFEETAPGTYTAQNDVNGWSISSRFATTCNSQQTWTPGSNKFALVTTPYPNFPGTLTASPFGGTVIAMLNDTSLPAFHETMLSRTISVNNSNYLFRFAYAARLWGGHPCCGQAGFAVNIFGGSCLGYSVAPYDVSCQTGDTTFNKLYSGWRTFTINLLPLIGNTISLEFVASDCKYGGHYAQVFLDVDCNQPVITCSDKNNPQNFGVSFCVGSNTAVINGITNIGYNSYQWAGPLNSPISPQNSSLSVQTITNPIPGTTYTLFLTSLSGCPMWVVYTLTPSQVSVTCTDSSPSCTGFSNGSATVIALGSSTGYNYIWTSLFTNSIVSTGSIATGLQPGLYSVTVSSPSGSVCGVGSQTILVGINNGTSPTVSITPSYTYVCVGSQILLTASGGQSYVWSNGVSTATNVISALSNSFYSVTVTSPNLNCPASSTATLEVFSPTINIIASPSVLCAGAITTLSAIGAVSYTWDTGFSGSVYSLSPIASKIFTVSAISSSLSLQCNVSGTIQVLINPLPLISIMGNTLMCINETLSLQASGALTYTWNDGSTSPIIQNTLMVQGFNNYTVLGTSALGCQNSSTFQVLVDPCTDLFFETKDSIKLLIYPNPSNGTIWIKGTVQNKFILLNYLAKVVDEIELTFSNEFMQKVEGLSAGFYLLIENKSGKTWKILVD